MKNLLIALVLVFTAQLSQAQTAADYNDYVKATAKLEIKTFVYDVLDLTVDEKKKFDDVFNKYLKKKGEIAFSRNDLFEKYLYGTDMTDKQLDALNKAVMKEDIKDAKNNHKYYKHFKKALGAKKTTALLYIIKYVDNLVVGARLDALAY